VPTDNRTLYRINGGLLSGFALGAWLGISREYPQTNLLADANDQGRQVFAEIADMTVEELIGYFPFRRMEDLTTVADPFAIPGAVLANEQIALGRRLPSAPVYLYHAIHDQLVPIVEADDLAATYRRGGVDVTLKRSRLGEHILFHRLGAKGVLHYLTSRLETSPNPPWPHQARGTQPPRRADRNVDASGVTLCLADAADDTVVNCRPQAGAVAGVS
jgi:hypothetical protein